MPDCLPGNTGRIEESDNKNAYDCFSSIVQELMCD